MKKILLVALKVLLGTIGFLLLAIITINVSIYFIHRNDHGQARKSFEKAQSNYKTHCSSCHGPSAQEFMQQSWKGEKNFHAILQKLKYGVDGTDMASFEAKMKDKELKGLSTFLVGKLDSFQNIESIDQLITQTGTVRSELMEFRLDTVVTSNRFAIPWAIEFLPDGRMLISDRSGRLFVFNSENGVREINGLPEVMSDMTTYRQAGLFDIALHPEFNNNHWLYFSYTRKGRIMNTPVVARGRLEGDEILDIEMIFEARPYSFANGSYGGRMAFDTDGKLLLTVGDRGSARSVQDLGQPFGKIIRLNADGSFPEDNPFPGEDGAGPAIFAYGFRNPQGIDIHPGDGSVWVTEHGPLGGDELNLVKKGGNYGWPLVTHGLNYDGTTVSDKVEMDGTVPPAKFWVPSISPCGISFVDSDTYPDWQGDLLIGGLGSRSVFRISLDGEKVISQEKILFDIGRVRDIKNGPDGFLYLSIEALGGIGIIYRIVPVDTGNPI